MYVINHAVMSVIKGHSNLLQGDTVVPVITVHNNVVTREYSNVCCKNTQ